MSCAEGDVSAIPNSELPVRDPAAPSAATPLSGARRAGWVVVAVALVGVHRLLPGKDAVAYLAPGAVAWRPAGSIVQALPRHTPSITAKRCAFAHGPSSFA